MTPSHPMHILVVEDQSDIPLVDRSLPGATGTDTLIATRGDCASARTITLTRFDRALVIQRALRAGSAAYVLKNTPKDELLKIDVGPPFHRVGGRLMSHVLNGSRPRYHDGVTS